jgi:solute carrier family 40 (iron-regulated transporter), member 1
VAILFSGTAGSLVDWRARLPFVRICILLQKGSSSAAYTLFLILFLRFRGETKAGGHIHALVWTLFAVIVLSGCVLKLATTGISVAIERDWVTIIADGDSEKLTRLNTYLRRIDLLSKLVAPLFVSLLTTVASYSFSAAFLLGFGIISMVFEFICKFRLMLCKRGFSDTPSGR